MNKKIKRTDKWLGTREIINSKLEIFIDEVNIVKAKIESGVPNSDFLKEELKLFEYMLSQENPEKLIIQLSGAQTKFPLAKRKIDLARKLKWNIEAISPSTGDKALGAIIYKARCDSYISLQEVSSYIGVTVPDFLDIEFGRRMPTDKMKEMIFEKLGIKNDQSK